jgi:membrane protease YdiL (CAAX protease family)
MRSKIQYFFTDNPLLILIVSALLIQLIGRYHASDFRIGRYFFISWVVLRLAVPFLVLFFLRIPISRIGLGMPRADKYAFRIILLMSAGLLVTFIGIRLFPGYLNFYAHTFGYSSLTQFGNFFLFTISTLTGWEFLHRGFLLMGIVYVLTEKEGISKGPAEKLAILFVWIFEVVFHFIKPEMEAVGMLAGSPLLSYSALRTHSIWTAFFLHLCFESIFIFSL